ncbi:BclA C-terminal domain-containing protein [Lysinibacillus agricola]|uniref:BclA C-terminal domain-containing protein n=1 Tax=Lysinibacillus agricola TaxID=2590012 RepID=UPI003C2A78C3
MNPCKNNCSCERCKKCGIPSRVIKAIEACEIPPPQETPPPPPPPLPSYGNFFQTISLQLSNNQPISWNGMGETAGITLDPDTVTIRVTQAGVYYIDYLVNVQFTINVGITAQTAIFVNEVQVNPIQTRYGSTNATPDRNECSPYSGGTIVSIPAGGTVQLRNVGPAFETCGGGETGVFLAASINLFKIN